MRHDIRTHDMYQKFAGYAGQGNWAIVASKGPVSLFEQGTNVWGFHPSLLTAEKDVQIYTGPSSDANSLRILG